MANQTVTIDESKLNSLLGTMVTELGAAATGALILVGSGAAMAAVSRRCGGEARAGRASRMWVAATARPPSSWRRRFRARLLLVTISIRTPSSMRARRQRGPVSTTSDSKSRPRRIIRVTITIWSPSSIVCMIWVIRWVQPAMCAHRLPTLEPGWSSNRLPVTMSRRI